MKKGGAIKMVSGVCWVSSENRRMATSDEDTLKRENEELKLKIKDLEKLVIIFLVGLKLHLPRSFSRWSQVPLCIRR